MYGRLILWNQEVELGKHETDYEKQFSPQRQCFDNSLKSTSGFQVPTAVF